MHTPQNNRAITRRAFLRLAMETLAVVDAGILADAYAWNVEPKVLVVEVRVRLPRLAKGTDLQSVVAEPTQVGIATLFHSTHFCIILAQVSQRTDLASGLSRRAYLSP